jgi:hypothetical protein
MAQFIENPRRAPRAPARCRTAVVTAAGAFESETEDIGSHGCQLVAPKLIRKGDVVRLTVTNEKVAEPLRVAGHVAWVSPQAPWRVGVAFDEGGVRDGTRWFDKLVAAHPGMAGFRRVPERIPVDAMVYLGPPPRFLRDFSAEEAMLLRAIASGVRVDELQARLHDRWSAAQRALFSLIARQAVTLSRGQAVRPDAWKQILTEVEASLAIDSLGKTGEQPISSPPPPPSPPPASPPPRAAKPAPPGPVQHGPAVAPTGAGATPAAPPWSAAPVQNPSRMIDLPDEGAPPLELAGPARDSRASVGTIDLGGWSPSAVPRADHAGAGGGWRGGTKARNAEAQVAYDRARVEVEAGNVNGALVLLRRALQLCPGDPEIGEALGRLAFKDRDPRAR